MGLKIWLWPRTLRARLLLLIVPLVSVAIVGSGYFLGMRSKSAILAEKEYYLLGVTQILRQQLAQRGGYAGLEGKAGAGANRLQVLNEALSPVAEDVARAFSGVGAGFYHRQLDAIVVYGPASEYGKRVGEPIAADHPGRQVMASARGAVVSGLFVRGNIMNAMTPIVEDGEVVGYIWANELIDEIDKTLSHMRNTVLLFSTLALFVSLAFVYFVVTHLTREIGVINKGLTGIGHDLSRRLPPLEGETGDIVKAINSMAQSLFDAQQKEREMAEQALHQREETLRTAIEAIDEAFVLYDPDDRLEYCNEKYLQSLPQARDLLVVGNTYEKILRGIFASGIFSRNSDSGEDLAEAILAAHLQGDSDFEVQTSDGRWWRMIDRKASTGHTVGFRIDITELKRAIDVADEANRFLQDANDELAMHREHLEQQVLSRTMELATARAEAEGANAVKTRFMANVSHEMRTPLQGILGFAEIGQRRATESAMTPQDAERYFAKILASGERMLRLVDSLLMLTEKVWAEQAGENDAEFQKIDLHEFIAEIAALMALSAEKRQQHLIFKMESVATTLVGDPVRLRQVFEHVIGNALRYSPPSATISIRSSDTRLPSASGTGEVQAVAFHVIDQGCGIPESEASTIFEPFYQSSRTASGAGGTGLGLPLSRSIVNRHGGRISLANRPEGGVVCEVILPAA